MQNKTGNVEAIRAYKFRICPDTKRQEAEVPNNGQAETKPVRAG